MKTSSTPMVCSKPSGTTLGDEGLEHWERAGSDGDVVRAPQPAQMALYRTNVIMDELMVRRMGTMTSWTSQPASHTMVLWQEGPPCQPYYGSMAGGTLALGFNAHPALWAMCSLGASEGAALGL